MVRKRLKCVGYRLAVVTIHTLTPPMPADYYPGSPAGVRFMGRGVEGYQVVGIDARGVVVYMGWVYPTSEEAKAAIAVEKRRMRANGWVVSPWKFKSPYGGSR